ncbi:MAG: hypothetical protein U0073_10185 [Bacteroidia bacterium]
MERFLSLFSFLWSDDKYSMWRKIIRINVVDEFIEQRHPGK